jgi:DNA (cytosine-5)-methyltransferase 1
MGQGGQSARCPPLAVTGWQGRQAVRYGSVCSGIEAATVAWHPLGWEAAWYSEIEPFPCAVLKHHYPAVPNYGDMTKYEEWPDEPINLLVGGTPCQSFSVAGLRKGLADPRGNLMLTYGAIARRYRPEWLVWENVPGVLSSNGGRDFGTFLGMLAELGYGFAYRVLDAQYFGVAQRRRRVFVVANVRSWQRAAAVLFESHSLQGHPAPSRETAKDVAGTFTARANSGGWGQDVDLAASGYMQVAHAQSIAYPMHGGMIGRQEQIGPSGSGFGEETDPSYTLTAGGQVRHGVAVTQPVIYQDSQFGVGAYRNAGSLRAGRIPEHQMVANDAMQVRRLTPVECERLQGFPDNYTNIPWRKKPESPDGPRYKALGNSMAVPVMAWIGKRIQQVSEL